ncbi:hypothetical protein KAR91_83090 [Candidatus Pacearchaeota archaeon]|nr:hypothetical protein [Candidatus Pacearchaeota archaeon]
MIDTIGFKIPIFPGSEQRISRELEIITTTDGSTGEELSKFCRGSLKGSWDSRISISIKDRQYQWQEDEEHERGGRTLLMACDPYLYCEFSLQKFLFAVNCFSYSQPLAIDGIYLFSEYLQEKIGCLPCVETWEITRLDISSVIKFIDNQTLDQYMDLLKRVEYPRRKYKSIVYQSSVMWVGAGQTFKLYSKQLEFKAHDSRRLNGFFEDKGVSEFITDRLDGCLRSELTLRKQVLRKTGIKYFFDLFDINMTDLMNRNLDRIGLKMENMRVWTSAEVRESLINNLLPGSGISPDAAFSIWVDMVVSGRATARRRAGDNKFYRATRIFKKLGINTITNLTETETILHPTELKPYTDTKILSFLRDHRNDLPCQNLMLAA